MRESSHSYTRHEQVGEIWALGEVRLGLWQRGRIKGGRKGVNKGRKGEKRSRKGVTRGQKGSKSTRP